MSQPQWTDHQIANMCHVHQQPEYDEPGDYRSCLECGHVWRTREEFVNDLDFLCRTMGWAPADNLPFCPLCSHDW